MLPMAVLTMPGCSCKAITISGKNTPLGALVAVLIVDGLHYLNYTAAKFNHDVIQLPFWALAGFAFQRALRGGWLGHWVLLGLAVGISLWAKYFVLVLVAPMALFALIDRDARQCLKTPGPYIAAAIALAAAAYRNGRMGYTGQVLKWRQR